MTPYEGTVLIAGATGFIGTHLARFLPHVRVLTRDTNAARSTLSKYGISVSEGIVKWAPDKSPLDASVLDGVDAIINLAGVSVADGRWTKRRKRSILQSRLDATNTLISALSSTQHRVQSLISASAVGYYGSCGNQFLTEDTEPGTDFLADVCKKWEDAAQPDTADIVRVVTPRIGIVLGPDGGALPKMAFPFKLFVGGKLGNGKHWMPWIQIDDLVGLFNHLLTSSISGPVNATAPNPVTNAEFTRQLAGSLKRPALFPVPRFVLRLLVGEFANALFASQRTDVTKAVNDGYAFRFPELKSALHELY